MVSTLNFAVYWLYVKIDMIEIRNTFSSDYSHFYIRGRFVAQGDNYEIKHRSGIIIYPRTSIKRPSGAFDPDHDHRMAFASALGALETGGLLLNHTCVNKTLPQFWNLWNHMLGLTTSK